MEENIHAFGEDVFDVVEEYVEGGLKYYRLQFKNKEKDKLDDRFNTRETAEWEADRWVRRNQDHPIVKDILFEKTVLK